MNSIRRSRFPRSLMPSKAGLPPVECCRGHESEPCRQVPPLSKHRPAANGRNQLGGTERADARYGDQPTTVIAVTSNELDFASVLADLSFEPLPVLAKTSNELPHSRRQSVLGVLQDAW